jgi:malate dehydrogenase (oxaloacetate-decarboxylating)(NADP+)
MAIRKEDALRYHSTERPGKLEVIATKPCITQRDLSLAYTPGVAEPCLEIKNTPSDVFQYTNKGNLVAVVSNGTAVLGLGNIGAMAGKPVMEGKGVLFKRFADIDVFDIEVASEDPEDVIRAVRLMEPTFGGINLEDIKAPECFYIEETLKKEMNIPVFHDDQHGTAIIVGAGLINALELVGKDIGKVRVAFSGAGAAGIAVAKMIVSLGIKRENIIMSDIHGVIYKGRAEGMNPYLEEFAADTKMRTLTEIMKGADVFIGVSVGGIVTQEMVKSMNDNPIVFAMANPDPEITYPDAKAARDDVIMATGRSDFPNQVNNVLGFPFIFRGALDVRATAINEEMKVAAAKALANLAKQDVPDSVIQAYGGKHFKFGPEYILPKPLDPRVLIWEASAVAQAAIESGVAQNVIEDMDDYRQKLEARLGRSYEVVRVVLNKAKSAPKRVVYPEGEYDKVLRAAQIILDEKIAEPILLGKEDVIHQKCRDLGLELNGVRIIDPASSDQYDRYVEEYFSLRQRFGVTKDDAKRLLLRKNFFATMMVYLQDADGFLGVCQNYFDEALPALQVIKTKKPGGKAAALYIMIFKKKIYFLADTSAIIDPTAEELAEIAIEAAKVVRLFEMEPRVAMLSFSNFGSVDHPVARKVQKAVQIALQQKPDLMIDGEMQADTALVPEIREESYPFSRLKGEANVLIFPELQSGNIAMNLLKRMGGVESLGPIQIGLAKPVHIIRRAATVEEIVRLTAFTVVDAQKWLM